MTIRMTKITRLILNHIFEYGFITAKQCSQIYFKNNKQGLVQAQVKLKNLYESGVIKRQENSFTQEYIYANDLKEISQHKMYLMNLYAYLYSKYEILYFNPEATWLVSKKRNDAHIIIAKDNGTKIGLLIEIDFFHKTGKDKLDSLYKSGEVQEWYGDNYDIEYYPSILIINALGKVNVRSNEYDIVTTNFDFDGLDNIL